MHKVKREAQLARIWEEQRLVNTLSTRTGKSLRVLFAGTRNGFAGPDFQNALLELDGVPMRGDVELHLEASDWRAHGHQEDPHYNGVILHAAYQIAANERLTIRADGRTAELLDLSAFLDDEGKRLVLLRGKKAEKCKVQVCPYLTAVPAEQRHAILRRMGMERLERKVERFKAESAFADDDQLLLQGLFEALGYSTNKLPMYNLALAMPWTRLSTWRGADADTLAAIWLGATGLLDRLPLVIPRPLAAKWRELYARQMYCREQVFVEWSLFRQRYTNHPAVRLAQAAALLAPLLGQPLFQRFLRLFSVPVGHLNADDLRSEFARLFHAEDQPEVLRIGQERLDTITLNILLPLVVLYARRERLELLEAAVMNLWRNFPRLTSNTKQRSLESLWRVRCATALEQQGALRVMRLWCDERRCDACTESLLKETL